MAENIEKQEKTKKKLQDALIALCSKKGFYNTSISEICSEAGTYRSTFYRYYESKDQLLREIERNYAKDMRQLTQNIATCYFDMTPETKNFYRKELARGMEYHRQHRELCLFLLSSNGDIHFHQMMHNSLREGIAACAKEKGVSSSRRKSYMENFFVHGYVATVNEWLQTGDCSAEDISDFILDMILQFSDAL